MVRFLLPFSAELKNHPSPPADKRFRPLPVVDVEAASALLFQRPWLFFSLSSTAISPLPGERGPSPVLLKCSPNHPLFFNDKRGLLFLRDSASAERPSSSPREKGLWTTVFFYWSVAAAFFSL